MAHAMRRQHRKHGPLAVLNSDGRSHPKENALAAVTAVLGAIAFVTGLFDGLHLISSWSGLVGVVAGAWGLLISATTEERFVLIVGLVASGVGLLLGGANGGLFGGLIG